MIRQSFPLQGILLTSSSGDSQSFCIWPFCPGSSQRKYAVGQPAAASGGDPFAAIAAAAVGAAAGAAATANAAGCAAAGLGCELAAALDAAPGTAAAVPVAPTPTASGRGCGCDRLRCCTASLGSAAGFHAAGNAAGGARTAVRAASAGSRLTAFCGPGAFAPAGSGRFLGRCGLAAGMSANSCFIATGGVAASLRVVGGGRPAAGHGRPAMGCCWPIVGAVAAWLGLMASEKMNGLLLVAFRAAAAALRRSPGAAFAGGMFSCTARMSRACSSATQTELCRLGKAPQSVLEC